MSTPYNDQWVLHPAGRGRRRRHAVEQLNREGPPYREPRIGGVAGNNGAAGNKGAAGNEPVVMHPRGKLEKRPKWIDRDT